MKILVIGSGGREHALAWRLHQAGHKIVGAPGNPGIAQLGEVVASASFLDVARVAQVDLTVVGPEAPLAAGVVDEFRAAGLPIVGPNRECAQLEASKVYSKRFMEEAGIPTARAVRVDELSAARLALDDFDPPYVIKADGLLAGKGVVIAESRAEAEEAVNRLGPKLVIEEFLAGEEVSFMVLSDGKSVVPLEATQDHKNIFDGDKGPNTGGMGAYCDGRILKAADAAYVMKHVIEPVIERTGFTGFLYAGLMMTPAGPKTLEFNVRLGDPETQALMHRMDCDFGELLYAAATKGLAGKSFQWRAEPSVCVVHASTGYPDTPRTGDVITGIEQAERLSPDIAVFHAGTKRNLSGELCTSGGRVLGVTARGATLQAAIDTAYNACAEIKFDGRQMRTDIGRKGLARWSG